MRNSNIGINKIIKIKTSLINLKNRHDIIFLYYVIINRRHDLYKLFCENKANRKVVYGKLFKLHKSIKKIGQINPIKIIYINNENYVVSGAHRMACILSLQIKLTKCIVVPIGHSTKWSDKKTINTHHFNNFVIAELDDFKKFLFSFLKQPQ